MPFTALSIISASKSQPFEYSIRMFLHTFIERADDPDSLLQIQNFELYDLTRYDRARIRGRRHEIERTYDIWWRHGMHRSRELIVYGRDGEPLDVDDDLLFTTVDLINRAEDQIADQIEAARRGQRLVPSPLERVRAIIEEFDEAYAAFYERVYTPAELGASHRHAWLPNIRRQRAMRDGGRGSALAGWLDVEILYTGMG